MTLKLKISLAIGMALSAAALYMAFHKVPYKDVLAYLGSINWWWTIPSALAAVGSFAARAGRWQVMLSLNGWAGYRMAWHPLMIGFLINCVLPGRLGELARPALMDRRAGIPYSKGLAALVAERLMDLVILMALFAMVAKTVAIDPHLDIPFGSYHLNKATLTGVAHNMVALSVLLFVFVVFMGIDRSRQGVVRALHAAANAVAAAKVPGGRWVQAAVVRRTGRVIDNIGAGFSLIKSPARLAISMVLGVGVWVVDALSFYLLALGCPGLNLSFGDALAYMIILCFFIALPSAPGFWGIWEAGGVFALYLFGVPTRDAVGYTLTVHVVQIVPIMLVGLISAVITGVNILALLRPSPIGPLRKADPMSGHDR
jgi:hypothetical protein